MSVLISVLNEKKQIHYYLAQTKQQETNRNDQKCPETSQSRDRRGGGHKIGYGAAAHEGKRNKRGEERGGGEVGVEQGSNINRSKFPAGEPDFNNGWQVQSNSCQVGVRLGGRGGLLAGHAVRVPLL